MVHTRRQSSRLRSTPQRRRDTNTPDGVASPAVAPTPTMPTLGEVDEQLESALPKQAATPNTSNHTAPNMPELVVCTPTAQTRIAPSRTEMHPHHYQHSTAKPLDEARWLGFQNMGACTEPVKKGSSKIPITQATPTKSQEMTTNFSTPEFKFSFRRPSLELSPEGKKLMEESRQEAEKIRAQMAANPEQFGIEKTEDIARRIATPKGKSSRFSDAHMAEFKKMDSIANHPSALRANRNRLKPAAAALKRSPSKAELDKQEKSNGKLPRTKSMANLRKAEEDSAATPAKRVKHSKEDDASTTRHVLGNGDGKKPGAHKSVNTARSNSGIPRSLSHLTTPTRASLARSQSVKTLKKTTLIPTLARSPSTQALKTPSKTPSTFMDNLRKASQTVSRLPSMRSILRSPVRHYSNDPAKIAAGTHASTPPDMNKELPTVPATEPAQKRVVFSESTLGRADYGNAKNARASSEVPQEAPSDVTYPKLPALSPARRTTMGAGDFTFRSDKTIKFGSGIKGPTIRHVRSSDASSTLPDPFNNTSPAKKRSVDVPTQIAESEKENDDEDGGRPAKRAKTSAKPATEKPEVSSKTPRRNQAGRGALSQSRLNALAQPKRPGTVATVASQLLSRVTQAISPRDPAAAKPRALDSAQQSLVHLQQAVHDFFQSYNLPVPALLRKDPQPSLPSSTLTALTEFAQRYADEPASLLVLLITLLAGILIGIFGLKRMSWSSRFGSWSGRFSPFGRGDTSSAAVSDADFSYITSEDLAASQKNLGASPKDDAANNNHINSAPPSGRSNVNGETDILVLKHKRVSYPVHFPRSAIDTGELSVRNIREAAARKMEVDDPRRIKLFYKGRQLKDDQQARAVGLRSDFESEILCVVGEGVPFGSSSKPGDGYGQRDGLGGSSGSESSDDNAGSSTPGGSRGKSKKNKRRRGGKKHKKVPGGSERGTPEPSGGYVGGGAGAEFLGVPTSSALPPRPSSSSSNNRPPPPAKVAVTPMEKLQELSSKFHTTLVPLCVQFMNRPPEETAKREFEHKKLTETVLAQVLLKLDAVETQGDEAARAKRKQLVKEANDMLTRLDEVMRN